MPLGFVLGVVDGPSEGVRVGIRDDALGAEDSVTLGSADRDMLGPEDGMPRGFVLGVVDGPSEGVR
eukprot:11349377-Prorocentrum_lima.AAC.1